MHRAFPRFANWASNTAGRPITFIGAALVIVLWAVIGPIVGFTDTWQLIINTGTTIVTFLMVFLIQNTQNRDGEAMQVKLDEIIRSIEGAQNALLDLEGLDSDALDKFRDQYQRLAKEAREERANGRPAAATNSKDESGGEAINGEPVAVGARGRNGEAVEGQPSPPKGPPENDVRDE